MMSTFTEPYEYFQFRDWCCVLTLISSHVSLTAILISRFLMDLQEANNATTHQHSHISSIGSLNFNRFIGSLGSSLPAPALGEASCQVLDDEPEDRVDSVSDEVA